MLTVHGCCIVAKTIDNNYLNYAKTIHDYMHKRFTCKGGRFWISSSSEYFGLITMTSTSSSQCAARSTARVREKIRTAFQRHAAIMNAVAHAPAAQCELDLWPTSRPREAVSEFFFASRKPWWVSVYICHARNSSCPDHYCMRAECSPCILNWSTL